MSDLHTHCKCGAMFGAIRYHTENGKIICPVCFAALLPPPPSPSQKELAAGRENDANGPDGFKTISEWQDWIRDELLAAQESVGVDGSIDGGGCDSGDWKDFTSDEIRQLAKNIADHWYDKHAADVGSLTHERDAALARLGEVERERDELRGKLNYSEVGRVAAVDDRDGWRQRARGAESALAQCEQNAEAATREAERLTREASMPSCARCLDTGIVSMGSAEGEDYCESCAIGREKSLLIELKESEHLGDRLSVLLTETAAALKGPPAPLTMHDWSDLPHVALAAITSLTAAESRAKEGESLLAEIVNRCGIPSKMLTRSRGPIEEWYDANAELRSKVNAHLSSRKPDAAEKATPRVRSVTDAGKQEKWRPLLSAPIAEARVGDKREEQK